MRIRLITVGKIKEKYLVDGINEYVKRIGGYCKLELVEVADEKIPDKAGEAIEIAIKDREGNRILDKINKDDYVVLLDLHGKMLDSEMFANHISEVMLHGKSTITFAIGGSLGLSDKVRERANFCLCFSKFTFPHQLMKLILLEQIYRAFKINSNETYHK